MHFCYFSFEFFFIVIGMIYKVYIIDGIKLQDYHFNIHLFHYFQEGRSIVENKTADIIQETRKLQIRRNGTGPSEQNQGSKTQPTQSQKQTSNEDQLTESRKVSCQPV